MTKLPAIFYELLQLVDANPKESYRNLAKKLDEGDRDTAMKLNALVSHGYLTECGHHDFPWWELTEEGRTEIVKTALNEYGNRIPRPPKFSR
jgi:hypothetical protein